MSSDTIREVTQSVIAVITFGAGFAILYFQPTSPSLTVAVSLMSFVGGYYFSRVTQTGTVQAILKAQDNAPVR